MKLFYDDEFDALAQTISNSEKTLKECAHYLRPDLKPDSAYAWLKECLNPKGDTRLKFGQIISLCRFCERFDALFYMADECQHERPTRKNPEDELAALQRTYIESVQLQRRIADRLEKLTQAPLASVKAA